MKSIILIYEGLADRPLDELGGKTPLGMAHCKRVTQLAQAGKGGMIRGLHREQTYRNEVFLAGILGLEPEVRAPLARGPLEALEAGLVLAEGDFAYRVNFITLDEHTIIESPVQGITEQETESLVGALEDLWPASDVSLRVNGPGRFVLVLRGVNEDLPGGHPPYVMEEQDYGYFLPSGSDGQKLKTLLEEARTMLAAHTINDVRLDLGENPANGLWIWGGGRIHTPPGIPFYARDGVAVFSRSNMMRGLAKLMEFSENGLENPWNLRDGGRPVFPDTPIDEALKSKDVVVIYLAAPRDFGLYGTGADKVRCLEQADQTMMPAMQHLMEKHSPCRIVVTTDGILSSKTGRQEVGDVPFILAGAGVDPDPVEHWDELSCAEGSFGTVPPEEILRFARSTL